jgi:aminopeptidase N
VFEWLEQTLGPYPFGDVAGVVEVDWGELGGGGMEHHPFWHVSTAGMDDIGIHAHEASHGWFGDGVRIACWEDLVLSEGTASYLEPRAIGQVVGPDAEAAIWSSYAETVEVMLAALDGIAWPDETCNEVDVLEGGTFLVVPYMKGAYFYRALAEQIGADALDAVLATFFQERVGTAAGMQDLLDTVESETGFDPTELADAWLRSYGIPEEI